jgi:trimethylamine:corrinoid methyltransferase-like protein
VSSGMLLFGVSNERHAFIFKSQEVPGGKKKSCRCFKVNNFTHLAYHVNNFHIGYPVICTQHTAVSTRHQHNYLLVDVQVTVRCDKFL